MGIFRRNTKQADDEPLEAAVDPTDTAVDPDTDPDTDTDRAASAERREVRPQASTNASETAYDRSAGPFDQSEVDGSEGRLDLGSLWISGVPGMELRLEVDNESQELVGVTAVLGESLLRLQAFAAPRTAGVWDEIRTEIAAGITGQGGTAEQVAGPIGPELQAQLPSRGEDGRTVYQPARFLGVDGPRWFLRGVISGRAAVDPEAAEALLTLLRSTVVVRGDEAMAPRDLLPLRLPEEAADEPEAEEGVEAGADAEPPAASRSADDLRPFERGPEITEVR